MAANIYLDYQATTPVDPRVLDRMSYAMSHIFGNPASRHAWGAEAAKNVEGARETIAGIIKAKPRQIYFTSGATEGNNLVVRGILSKSDRQRTKILTTPIEHSSVAAPLATLAGQGFSVQNLKVDSTGLVDLDDLRSRISTDALAVALIGGHNEFGTIQPLDQIGKLCHDANVLFLVDAAQIVGKIPIDVEKSKIDFLTASAHKFYGPKGMGFVYVRNRPKETINYAILQGGGQEHELRSGTLNVPAIIGMAEALLISDREMDTEVGRITDLREKLWRKIKLEVPCARLNGNLTQRIAGNLNISFPGIDGNAILTLLPHVGLSTGSACSSHSVTASPSLLAIGLSEAEAFSTVRLCVGRFTTESEVKQVAEDLVEAVKRLGNAKL